MDATSARERILPRVSRLLDRPARWASTAVGDYEGRERTLEVFDADAPDQLALRRLLRPIRDELHAAAGGAVIVIFHTRAESERLYGELLRAWRSEQPADRPMRRAR
jgi:hypothetical protein